MIVTIDGPAGSGKSTAARMLAKRLGIRFLDTGAMYRAVALACLRAGIDPADEPAAGTLAKSLRIEFDRARDRILCDGEDVTDSIRTTAVTTASSKVAMIPAVRAAMVKLQRRAAEGQDIVSEGRDQGTVVFPGAEFKFFLTASDEVRADRRRHDLHAAGTSISRADMLAELRERDERDKRRTVAPLRPADDAVVIDTSHLSVEQMLAEMERVIREGIPRPPIAP
jgi:CMP/dCMP kinase